jgi:hypothetical protein
VSNGISFVGCQFTRGDTSITNVTLAGSNGSQNGNVAWINSTFDTNCYRTPSAAVTNDDPRLLAAENATLTIPAAYAGDAASYSVVVSNVAGVVTSGSAVLTVGNTAPSLDPISDQTINPGETLSLTATASDPDSPPQSLTFTLSTAPANASIGSSSGLFTWRPRRSHSRIQTSPESRNGSIESSSRPDGGER